MSSLRPWDAYDVYLFDVDGTLLNCTDAVHYFAFCSVLSEVAGRELNLDGVTAHGNTDVGILRDALALAGISEEAWRPRLKGMRSSICRYLLEREHQLCVTTIPGIEEVLTHLRSRGAVLGVATGNLEQIGRTKLRHCQLQEYFDFETYSDEFEYRSDVFQAAVLKARILCGATAAVCVVGDTPADIVAAKACGVDVIAVATGIYSVQQLRAEQPDYCVSSLQQLPHRQVAGVIGSVPQ